MYHTDTTLLGVLLSSDTTKFTVWFINVCVLCAGDV